MNTPRKTPWFQSRSTRPTLPGVYLTRMRTGNVYWRAFDGQEWRGAPQRMQLPHAQKSPSLEDAVRHFVLGRDFETARDTHFEWRGLASDPNT